MLRFVVDVTPAQKRALTSSFEKRYQARSVVYGVHASSSALLTCLVFAREGNHVHFVDGGDGGYALAAVELKRRMKDLKAQAELRSAE